MVLKLDKINIKFRQLVDLLLYSDRIDLDLSKFKVLLKEDYDINLEYILDRFKKSSEIAWENGELFWSNRLSFLFSLNDKLINKFIEDFLERRMICLIRSKYEINIKYNIEYLQYLELCKVKKNRKEDLTYIKNHLADMLNNIKLDKLIGIINSFIPVVFADLNEFALVVSKKISNSARSFDLLIELEKRGIVFDKLPIAKLAMEILIARKVSEKSIRAFFTLINNKDIMQHIKKEYLPVYKNNLINLLNYCDHLMIEENHLRNIKNIIELDSSIADELADIYADKLYLRWTVHKKANADRLIRLLKLIPQISPKKVLVYLSSHNKMNDIKYILNAFPELKKFSAFV